MEFIDIPTEQTTAATDAILAIMALAAAVYLGRNSQDNRWKTSLWIGVFGLLSIASGLGAVVHGFNMPEAMRTNFWHPLFLSLGLLVAFFIVAAINDVWGEARARRVLPAMMIVGLGFFGLTLIWPDSFLVFVIYELLAMLFALGGYIYLASRKLLMGAELIASGIFATILGSGIQASKAFAFTCIWSFDHNSVYHLVQIVGVGLLVMGLRKTLTASS
ncbi:MAG: hypothetical protein ACI9UK_001094 [Candidatus Krumholzibacteriia bacterium]|jgi:hypothetical protein